LRRHAAIIIRDIFGIEAHDPGNSLKCGGLPLEALTPIARPHPPCFTQARVSIG
jgi:hypothetical protein